MLRLLTGIFLLPAAAGAGALAAAQDGGIQSAQPDLLHPRQAFVFAASLEDEVVRIDFSIEPGYYLYRERFEFFDAAGATLPGAEFPPGQVVEDEFFGVVETYRDAVAISLPVPAEGQDLQLLMVSQGCADIGVCFPPEKVTLAFAGSGGAGRIVGDYSVPDFAVPAGSEDLSAVGIGDSGRAFAALSEQPLAAALATFFLFGLLLAFTPCVLPMVPIVLAIVTGGRNPPGTSRAFALCSLYVLAMATVYAAPPPPPGGSGCQQRPAAFLLPAASGGRCGAGRGFRAARRFHDRGVRAAPAAGGRLRKDRAAAGRPGDLAGGGRVWRDLGDSRKSLRCRAAGWGAAVHLSKRATRCSAAAPWRFWLAWAWECYRWPRRLEPGRCCPRPGRWLRQCASCSG